MSNTTVIQIKRSTTDAVPSNVVFGELAYSTNGDVLFIGDASDTAIAIGGKRNPGVLTANQALVTNATSYLDQILVDSILVSNAATINVLTVTSLNTAGGTTQSGNIAANNITISNNLTVNGDIILRGSSLQFGDGGDIISIGATVNSSIIPTSNDSFNLGSSSSFWSKLFADEIQQPNDAPLTTKFDILWKKIGFNKVSTDFISLKKATDETIVSDLIIKPSEIWNQTTSIPSNKPANNTAVILLYSELECVEDNTSTSLRTWKTNLTNWIPPRFGSTYQLEVKTDTAGSTNAAANGTAVTINGSNDDGWYFDYQSGVLRFIGSNLPASLTAGKSVFVTGARYIGTIGFDGAVLTNANLVNATITSLSSPLPVQYGGTGVSSFTANSLLAGANSSTLGFKTGSNGQVMIVLDNDVNFSDLDGGTY